MGVDRDVVQAAAPRRPHDGVEVLVVLHQDGDGVAFAQTVPAEEVGEAVGAGLQLAERHRRAGRMHDDGSLVGGGLSVFADLHESRLYETKLDACQEPWVRRLLIRWFGKQTFALI